MGPNAGPPSPRAADGDGPDVLQPALGHTDFDLVAIPLRRHHIARHLRDWQVPPRGSVVAVVEQRPPVAIRERWLRRLESSLDAGVGSVITAALATDDAMSHLGTSTTDRLVPRHFLADDTYLERNLGGWAPLWFGPLAVVDRAPGDPLLAGREVIASYGSSIRSHTVPVDLVAGRVDTELRGGPEGLTRSAGVLRRLRTARAPRTTIATLVAALRGDGPEADVLDPMLAFDELIEQLYRLELERRRAAAEDDQVAAAVNGDHLAAVAETLGVRLLLKGEYLLGRHRRSTVLLAEGLDVVVKQPAPEPRHDIELGARTHDGEAENWPHPIGDGAMVTPRAALGQVVGSTAVERLNEVFGRDVEFATLVGLSVEPFEAGPTLADLAVRRPDELTSDRYDEVLVHQLVCEALDVDNPDWHAANFMVTDTGLVHVDWGAARPVDPGAHGPDAVRARLDQVRELAWSFQDETLAARTTALHERATDDPDHLDRLRRRARERVEGT